MAALTPSQKIAVGVDSGLVRVEWRQGDIERIQRNLMALTDELKKKTLRAALSRGAEIVRLAARAKVPIRTGRLRDSLKKTTMYDPSAVIARVYAARSRGNIGGFYAHLVEFGHRKIVRAGRGLRAKLLDRGFQPATPFLRPALEENRQTVITVVADEVQRRVETFSQK